MRVTTGITPDLQEVMIARDGTGPRPWTLYIRRHEDDMSWWEHTAMYDALIAAIAEYEVHSVVTTKVNAEDYFNSLHN